LVIQLYSFHTFDFIESVLDSATIYLTQPDLE
jgi:hypothetical protein